MTKLAHLATERHVNMTIRDIALIADVSVSTVSKVINKKDTSISEETRRRVLKVVKEYNYSPYANVQPSASSLLLGISVALHDGHEQLMTSIVKSARDEGYSTIVCTSSTPEDEYKNLSIFSSHNVDGIIWDRVADSTDENVKKFVKQGIPCQVIDVYREPVEAFNESLSIDYFALGYETCNELIVCGHKRIGCIVKGETYKSKCFTDGFRRSLFDNNIPFEDEMVWVWDEGEKNLFPQHLLHHFTGVVCSDYGLAILIKQQTASFNIKIPRDLSVVAISSTASNLEDVSEGISSITVPFGALGSRCVNQLVEKIEGRASKELLDLTYNLNHRNSIDIPGTVNGSKIIVVGSINIDTLMHFDRMPQMGETLSADNRTLVPGGKGLNQAIAASKMGADTYLIGKIGRDHDGSILYDCLKMNNVNTEGVEDDPGNPTGSAYIYIGPDGESSIVVYKGANKCLQMQDLDRFEDLFKDAKYCLLQTEISMEMVERAAQMAHKHGAKVILKPCVVSELSDTVLKYTDILIPNEKEACRLLGSSLSNEGKAEYFIGKGVDTVIITLGAAGCYLRDSKHSRYFEAVDVKTVDTTGASDVFAATLAVYLSRDHDTPEAITYATYAAGLSTTRQGISSSLVDQNALELYMSVQHVNQV